MSVRSLFFFFFVRIRGSIGTWPFTRRIGRGHRWIVDCVRVEVGCKAKRFKSSREATSLCCSFKPSPRLRRFFLGSSQIPQDLQSASPGLSSSPRPACSARGRFLRLLLLLLLLRPDSRPSLRSCPRLLPKSPPPRQSIDMRFSRRPSSLKLSVVASQDPSSSLRSASLRSLLLAGTPPRFPRVSLPPSYPSSLSFW